MTRKICIFLPDLRGGGAEKMHIEMARVWQESGCQVEFILIHNSGDLKNDIPDGVVVHEIGKSNIFKCFFPLIKKIREVKPDILIGVMWPLSILSILSGFFSKETKVVVSDHNTLSQSYSGLSKLKFFLLRKSIRYMYPYASLRRVVSKGMRKDIANLSGVEEELFYVLYNPAAPSGEKDKTFTLPKEISNEGLNILCVGSLKKQKNYDLLIRAISKLPTNFPVTVNVLGEGELRQELEDKSRKYNVDSKIKFLGFRSNTTDYFTHSDLFVLTSDYEGFGNVIVESLNQGLPVISTNCPSGPSEILNDGQFGVLIPVNDDDALSKAILNFKKSDFDQDSLKSRAKEFSSYDISMKYLEKFNKL